jgi:uncharacterized protein YecE (DUF72 family)
MTPKPPAPIDDVLIGTASWTDKSLVDSGRFYPPDARSAESRLRFYAARFPLVEVDSSYYGLPTAQNSRLWVERTPPRFVFDVKAFRLFTQHQTPPSALPTDIAEALPPTERKHWYLADLPEELQIELWRRFIAGIEPLRAAGKLGAILFQFPPWFLRNAPAHRHLEAIGDVLKGYRIAVEFRNKLWFDGENAAKTLQFAREHRLVHVVVDGPQGFHNSVPPIWEATDAGLAIVRLHGRNRDTWNQKGLSSSTERFNYLYSTEELSDLVPGIRRLIAPGRQVHVLFNNNFEDYAQRNAGQLVRAMGAGGGFSMSP